MSGLTPSVLVSVWGWILNFGCKMFISPVPPLRKVLPGAGVGKRGTHRKEGSPLPQGLAGVQRHYKQHSAMWVKGGPGLDLGLNCCFHLGALGVLQWPGWDPAPPSLCHGGHCWGAGRSPSPWKGSDGISGGKVRPCSSSLGSPQIPVPAAGPSSRHCRGTDLPPHPRGRDSHQHLPGRENPNPAAAPSGREELGGPAGAAASFPFSFPVSQPLPGPDRSNGRPPGPFLTPPETGGEPTPSPVVELGGSVPAQPAPPPTLPDSW